MRLSASSGLHKWFTGNDCNAEKSPSCCGNAAWNTAQNPAMQSSKCPSKWPTSVEPCGSRGSHPILSEGTNRIRCSVRSICSRSFSCIDSTMGPAKRIQAPVPLEESLLIVAYPHATLSLEASVWCLNRDPRAERFACLENEVVEIQPS